MPFYNTCSVTPLNIISKHILCEDCQKLISMLSKENKCHDKLLYIDCYNPFCVFALFHYYLFKKYLFILLLKLALNTSQSINIIIFLAIV